MGWSVRFRQGLQTQPRNGSPRGPSSRTAHRSLTYSRQIFDFGDACGFLPGKNPTAPLGRVLAPVSVTHHASIYSPEGLGELMLAIESYAGEETTGIALDILPRTITRSKELRFAEW